MNVPRRDVTKVIGFFAGVVVVLLAMGFPAVYFTIAWKAQDAALKTEARFYANEVSHIISRNPEMWEYETVRLSGILSGPVEESGSESRSIMDGDGNLVAEWREELPSPVMTRSHPLKDAGETVGTVEIRRSMSPLIQGALYAAMIGCVLAMLLFSLVRVYPVSALRNALQLLSHEKKRAQVTLHSIGEGVITADSEGRIVLVNRVGENLTGWPQAEAVGRLIGEVFRLEEGVLVSRSGKRRVIETGTSPILDEDGLSYGTVLVFRDMTERARNEAEMQRAQKLESLGILAAGIAHEIRNPLSAVNISVSSIENILRKIGTLEPEAGERIRLIMEQMRSATTKMASVVQRVLDFSKPSPSRKKITDMNDIVEEAVLLSSSTLRKREISLSKNLAGDLPACHADPRMMEQVLVNLITNAYQAMEGMEGMKRLEISSAVQDEWIVIRVSDSGPGVPHSIRDKIFDPFFTTRKEGTGIGLSFSHRIVTDHGGRLQVDTSRWNGAEFRIELPRFNGVNPA